MMRTIVAPFLAFSFVLSTVGCSFLGMDEAFRDRSNDYRRSAELPHIEVREELDSEVVGELYPVPETQGVVGYQVDSGFQVPRPRSVAINVSGNEVKIQSLGEESWILTSVSPGETWPLVRSFLAGQSIATARADANEGLIETGWFLLSDDENVLHQFLITLSQGVQLNTTEIEILQRSYTADDVPDDLSEWPARSVDADKESWMQEILASALAEEDRLGTASLLGREIGAAQKVSIVAPENDNPYIDMRLVFERAWASVGYALGNDGFSITDRSTESRYYIADYSDPLAKERGFFQRLFGANRAKPESYQVILELQGDERVWVKVYDASGAPLNQRDSYILLERIRDNLT